MILQITGGLVGWLLPRHLLLSKIITQNSKHIDPPPPPQLWRSPAVLLWIKLNNIWSSWQGKHASKYLISRLGQTPGGRTRAANTESNLRLLYWVKRQRGVSDHQSPWAKREIDLINPNCSVTKLINQSYHKTHKGCPRKPISIGERKVSKEGPSSLYWARSGGYRYESSVTNINITSQWYDHRY